MKRSLLLMSAVSVMMLAACGQKGALYLPDEQRNVAVSPAAAAAPATATPATSPAPAEPAATTPTAAAPAATPPTDNAAAGAASPIPADNSDPPPRRSNTAPRTN